MNPRYPLYIVSKGRWESRLTSKALEWMRVPYCIVVEEQEYDRYAEVIDPKKILVLGKRYQREYDTCDNLGLTKSTGPGPARNFAWDHSVKEGHAWHWIMDDNIRYFFRLNRNLEIRIADGTGFRCMEDFALRYENVAMVGPNYYMFAPRRAPHPPFTLNTRIYSCNLIRCDLPYRWRGRYNEDTDLSLRVLKDGWCTVQFYAFLQEKMPTQQIKGGNTKDFYEKEGTTPKTLMLQKMHPDVTEVKWKFGRVHHLVHYEKFMKENKLILKKEIKIPTGTDEYGMKLIRRKE